MSSRTISFCRKCGGQLLLLLTLCLFLGNETRAQAYRWGVAIGNIGSDEPIRLATDSSAVYVGGDYSSPTLDFDTSLAGVVQVTAFTGVGTPADFYIARFDTAGNVNWAFDVGGVNEDRLADLYAEPNGLAIVGTVKSSTSFDPTTGTASYFLNGVYGGYFARYRDSITGVKFLTVSVFDSVEVNTLTKDLEGNYYLSGSFEGTQDFGSGGTLLATDSGGIFLSKYDPNGDFLWVKNFGPSINSNVREMIFGVDGQLYLTGTFANTGDFDPGPGGSTLTSGGAFDGFLATFDTAGNFVRVLQLETTGTNSVAIVNLDQDQAGNLYVGGNFNSGVDLDPGPGTFFPPTFGQTDGFFAKYAPDGSLLWGNSLGSVQADLLRNIQVDPNGKVFLSGDHLDDIDFDPGPGTLTVSTSTVNEEDGYLVRYDTDGNLEWLDTISGSGKESSAFFDIHSSGDLFLTGSFSSDIDLDPGSGVASRTSAGNNDIFLARYENCVDVYLTQQPDSLRVCNGDAAQFTLHAAGSDSANFQYQWQENTGAAWTVLTNGGVYSGVDSNVLDISNGTGLGGRAYRCKVTGTCSAGDTTLSDSVQLTVQTDTTFAGRLWNADTTVALANIEVYAVDTSNFTINQPYVTTTNSQGFFEVNVSVSPSFLWADVQAGINFLLPTYFGDTALIQGATLINIASCRTEGLDIHADTLFGGTSTGGGGGGGYVSQTQGSGKTRSTFIPAENLTLFLADSSGNLFGRSKTDDAGYFYFSDLDPDTVDYFLWTDYPNIINVDSAPAFPVQDSAFAYTQLLFDLRDSVLHFVAFHISVEESPSDWPLKLYPNPNTGRLYVKNLKEPALFSLFDLQGNLRFEQELSPNYSQLSLPANLSGVYLARVRSEQRVKTFRLVILGEP